MKMENKDINFKLDTGAQANVISFSLLKKKLRKTQTMRKTKVRLSTYTGQKIAV